MEKSAKVANNPYQVSKWVYQRGLLDLDELENLITSLGDIYVFPLGKVLVDPKPMEITTFYALYKEYLQTLHEGKKPSFPAFALTADPDRVQVHEISSGRYLMKPERPVVEIRHYTFLVTSDGRIQSLVYGPGSIPFGLQFAYPTLFIDPDKKGIVEMLKEREDPNTELYKEIAKWFRSYTAPAPIAVGDKVVKAPFRIGKEALVRGHGQNRGIRRETKT